MRFMVMVPATAASEAGTLPTAEQLTEMHDYNEQLVKAGVVREFAGLHPSSKGARITFGDDEPAVVDGPFAESKELIAGYSIWEVSSREEAIAWIKRAPFARRGAERLTVELRQVFTAEDFAPVDTSGEIRERVANVRETIAKL